MHSSSLEKKRCATPGRRNAQPHAGEEMHSNALDTLRDAPGKRRMAKHRIGNAQKRTAQEKLRLPRTCVGKVGYGCARTCEGKATAKNRCTAHWN